MGSKLQIMLHNNSRPGPELNFRNVILLENQSTPYFICNKRFTSEVNKSKTKLKVQGNGGTLVGKHMSKISGYNQITWFGKKDITNILSLKNMTKQYRVTYNSNNETFIVHRKEAGPPNMKLRMHSSELHLYHPNETNKSNITLINKVS